MAKRHVIKGEGVPSHPQPFPTAIRIGNMIFSSGIGGHDADGNVSDDKATQVAQAFANMKLIVESGGGTVGDIAKVVVYMKSRDDRPIVNEEWVKMFPNEDDRPCRHAVELPLGGNRMIQLEIIAVV